MTDTMIEKAASEAKEAFWREVEDHTKDPDWPVIIRAALLAIREAPMDIGLIGAAEVNKQMRGAVKADYCAAQDSFTAMIDAILAGEA